MFPSGLVFESICDIMKRILLIVMMSCYATASDSHSQRAIEEEVDKRLLKVARGEMLVAELGSEKRETADTVIVDDEIYAIRE
jgi:hypothetical protein